MVLGTALIAIVGGVGWAWGAHLAAGLVRRVTATRGLAPELGVVVAVAALFVAIPPWIGRKVVSVPATHGALVYQAHLRRDIARPSRSSAARLGSCVVAQL